MGGYQDAIDEASRGCDRDVVAGRLEAEIEQAVRRALDGSMSAFDVLRDPRVRDEARRRWRLRVEAGDGTARVVSHNGAPLVAGLA